MPPPRHQTPSDTKEDIVGNRRKADELTVYLNTNPAHTHSIAIPASRHVIFAAGHPEAEATADRVVLRPFAAVVLATPAIARAIDQVTPADTSL